VYCGPDLVRLSATEHLFRRSSPWASRVRRTEAREHLVLHLKLRTFWRLFEVHGTTRDASGGPAPLRLSKHHVAIRRRTNCAYDDAAAVRFSPLFRPRRRQASRIVLLSSMNPHPPPPDCAPRAAGVSRLGVAVRTWLLAEQKFLPGPRDPLAFSSVGERLPAKPTTRVGRGSIMVFAAIRPPTGQRLHWAGGRGQIRAEAAPFRRKRRPDLRSLRHAFAAPMFSRRSHYPRPQTRLATH